MAIRRAPTPLPLSPGTWLRELAGQRRRLLVHAVRTLPGLADAHVELLIDGQPGSRVSLAAAILADRTRYAVEAAIPPELSPPSDPLPEGPLESV